MSGRYLDPTSLACFFDILQQDDMTENECLDGFCEGGDGAYQRYERPAGPAEQRRGAGQSHLRPARRSTPAENPGVQITQKVS